MNLNEFVALRERATKVPVQFYWSRLPLLAACLL
jgi:hypothetical protein